MIFRQNESDEKYQERLEKVAYNIDKRWKNMEPSKKRQKLDNDADRKQRERSDESPDSANSRRLAAATRNFETRAKETDMEHKSRADEQRERQTEL